MTWPFGDLKMLRSMAADPSCALELGKAAEHFVCADLILQGFRAYLSDQGLPYDIVIDFNGRLIRVQVKAACYPKNVNVKGRHERIAYTFHVRRRGKNGQSRLSNDDCDIVALVALDTRQTAYLPIEITGQCVQISPDGKEPEVKIWRSGWLRTIGQWPISDALIGSSAYQKVTRRVEKTQCDHGHVFSEVGGKRSYGCPECNRIRSRNNAKRKLQVAK